MIQSNVQDTISLFEDTLTVYSDTTTILHRFQPFGFPQSDFPKLKTNLPRREDIHI